MKKSPVHKILESAYGTECADKIIESYQEIEGNFILRKWKPSELDSGHFVESVRRIVENELFGAAIDYSKKIGEFKDSILTGYENASGDESFRMLIPRALKSIYNIRNKRGVGHIGKISPNEMDATYILYSVKWILSEIVRIKTNLTIEETQKLISSIIERRIEMLWKSGNIIRILNTKLKAHEQILILLYDESPLKDEVLLKIVEYKNKTNFLRILDSMHKKRLIEYSPNGECHISVTGTILAEKIRQKNADIKL